MTMFVLDTFTGSGQLVDHVGEIGASWTIDTVIGNGEPADLVLDSDTLVKAVFSVGVTAAYPSGIVTGDYAIEMGLVFTNPIPGERDGQVLLYDAEHNEIGEIGSNGNFAALSGVGLVPFVPVDNQTYIVRFECVGGAWSIRVDGTVILSGDPGAVYAQPISLGLYDRNGDSVAIVDYYQIGPISQPADGPFISTWNAGAAKMRYQWSGKLWLLAHPQGLQFVRVRAEDYADVTVVFEADGAALLTKVVTDDKAFRLPVREDYDEIEYIVTGTSRVWSVELADDVNELSG